MVSRVNLYLKKSSFTVNCLAGNENKIHNEIFDKSVSNYMYEEGFSSVIYLFIYLFIYYF